MPRWTITFGEAFLAEARHTFPDARSSAYDGLTYGEFMAGPVRAARLRFSYNWEDLPAEAGPGVRMVWVFSPTLGPVVFYGVLVREDRVEVAGFDRDPDYWELVDDDPDDR